MTPEQRAEWRADAERELARRCTVGDTCRWCKESRRILALLAALDQAEASAAELHAGLSREASSWGTAIARVEAVLAEPYDRLEVEHVEGGPVERVDVVTVAAVRAALRGDA